MRRRVCLLPVMPRFVRQRFMLFAAVVLACVGGVSCTTRSLSNAHAQSKSMGFIHWDPHKDGPWTNEKVRRQNRYNEIAYPFRRPVQMQNVSGSAAQVADFLTGIKNWSQDALTGRQAAAWGFEWYLDTPVGYSGIPFVIFRAMLDEAKNASSEFKEMGEIWGDLSLYGLTPHPREFDEDGMWNPEKMGRQPLPLGMGWTRSPVKVPDEWKSWISTLQTSGSGAGSQPAVKAAVKAFMASRVQRAFISCGACHTGRVAIPTKDQPGPKDFSFQFLFGAPSTEYDQTGFGSATARTLEVIAQYREEGKLQAFANQLMANIKEGIRKEGIFSQYHVQALPTVLQPTATRLLERAATEGRSYIQKSGDLLTRYPYGDAYFSAMRLGAWRGEFPLVWAALERKILQERLLDILTEMPTSLDLRNKIVGHLRQSAYARQNGGKEKPPFDGHTPGSLDAFGFGAAIVKVLEEQLRSVEDLEKFQRQQAETNLIKDWFGQAVGDDKGWPADPRFTNEVSTDSDRRVVNYFRELLHLASNGDSGERVVPQFAAKVDPQSIWGERSTKEDDARGLRNMANWDGNQQSAGARALSTSLAIVASPAKVDVHGSEAVAAFMAHDPGAGLNGLRSYRSMTPVYPFDVDQDLAAAGQSLYEMHCYGCHFPGNERIYPIKPEKNLNDQALLSGINALEALFTSDEIQGFGEGLYVGTDPNRAIQITSPIRAGLLGLWNDTCRGRKWCKSSDGTGKDKDVFRKRGIRGGEKNVDKEELQKRVTGYIATPLDGIWAKAPYLHNGSVPTLYHLLVPAERDVSVECMDGKRKRGFWRGNVMYDQQLLGFEWKVPPFLTWNCDWTPRETPYDSPFPPDSVPRYQTASRSARIFDYAQEGASNKGHSSKYYLGDLDWKTAKVDVNGTEYPAYKVLIEYMKTL
jgi:hypothetical protein